MTWGTAVTDEYPGAIISHEGSLFQSAARKSPIVRIWPMLHRRREPIGDCRFIELHLVPPDRLKPRISVVTVIP